MCNMDSLGISCIKNNVNYFSGKICQFHKESCLIMDLCFFIELLHIHSLRAKDLCLDLLFIFIKNLDSHRLCRNGPATYPEKSLLNLLFFNKKLWFISSLFQILDRNRKPAESFVRHIRINRKFLKSIQRLRKTNLSCDPLPPHKVRILESLQCADHLKLLDLRFYL